jgi:phage terminase large subunit-like protein
MENQTADYVAIARQYARVASLDRNRDRFNKWTRLAARRFLRDLKRCEEVNAPFYFDEWHANDPCDFIEKLPHVEGQWFNEDGSKQTCIVLHPSDVFFLVNVFGFRNQDGSRRFTQALKCIARKNAKSTLAAAIGLYCETCEGETGPQVIAAATTGNQARIVFNIAKRMAEMTSDLREAFNLEPFANAIACYKNFGTFKPINSKASNQDGLNPSCSILDEIHAHQTHDLINVLRSAAGARRNPLFLYTTTEGYENAGPWAELRHMAQQVLEGIIEADHFFCVIYSLDEEDKDAGIKADDDFDESKWRKANPLMDCNPLLLAELRKGAIDAKAMPGSHAEFKIKRLNLREAAQGRWVSLPKWRRNTADVSLDYVRGHQGHGGLDLASVSDLASFRMTWDIDGVLYTLGRRFVPRVAIERRSRAGLVPYHHWIASGHLIECGDETLDYDLMLEHILEFIEPFDVGSINYDTWNSAQPAKRLTEEGYTMVPFIQGAKSYHPCIKEVERRYLDGNIAHGNDPVLNWCIANVVMRLDPNMNMAPDKKKAAEKIDDACALFMSVGGIVGAEGETSIIDALRSPIVG